MGIVESRSRHQKYNLVWIRLETCDMRQRTAEQVEGISRHVMGTA
jgi:hypothetical protein